MDILLYWTINIIILGIVIHLKGLNSMKKIVINTKRLVLEPLGINHLETVHKSFFKEQMMDGEC